MWRPNIEYSFNLHDTLLRAANRECVDAPWRTLAYIMESLAYYINTPSSWLHTKSLSIIFGTWGPIFEHTLKSITFRIPGFRINVCSISLSIPILSIFLWNKFENEGLLYPSFANSFTIEYVKIPYNFIQILKMRLNFKWTSTSNSSAVLKESHYVEKQTVLNTGAILNKKRSMLYLQHFVIMLYIQIPTYLQVLFPTMKETAEAPTDIVDSVASEPYHWHQAEKFVS